MTKPKTKSISSGCNESYLTHAYCVSKKDAFGLKKGEGGSYPFRPNCFIEPLITGDATLEKLADLIESAESSIDILVWGFNPSLRLKRTGNHSHDKNYRLGTMLAKKALDGVKVRVCCYYAIGVLVRGGNAGGVLGGVYNYFKEKDILEKLDSIESPSTYVHTWFLLLRDGKLKMRYVETIDPATVNSSFYKDLKKYQKRMDEYTEYVTRWRKDNPDNIVEHKWKFWGERPMTYDEWIDKNPRKNVHPVYPEKEFVSEMVLEYTSSPHQKMVLIDFDKPKPELNEPSALVMGNNLKLVDWDTKAHSFKNDLRDGVPRQDVASHLKGPILNDLNANFEEVYNGVIGMRPNLARPSLDASITNKKGYNHALQLCRTFIQNNETAIHHLYANAIGQIDEYAYFENQYFRHEKLTDQLVTRMKYLKNSGSDKTPHIFLVIEPAGVVARGTTEETMAKIAKSPAWEEMKKDMKAPDIAELEALGAKISLCSLASSGKVDKFWGGKEWKYIGINIHTKVLISDDVFFTIGSANFNYRSMVSDNELNVACHDECRAEEFRHNLMKIHMGKSNYSDKYNIEKLFNKWEALKKKNDSIIEGKTSSLKAGSHIVSYSDEGDRKWRLD